MEVLSVMDPVIETFTRYEHRPDDPGSLPESIVSRILEDKNGIIWLATEGPGLSRMDPAQPGSFMHVQHDPDDPTINGFHFQHPDKNRFEYKLEGFSDDWIDAGTRRTAAFTNLSPGDYEFRMRAANSDGVWRSKMRWPD